MTIYFVERRPWGRVVIWTADDQSFPVPDGMEDEFFASARRRGIPVIWLPPLQKMMDIYVSETMEEGQR